VTLSNRENLTGYMYSFKMENNKKWPTFDFGSEFPTEICQTGKLLKQQIKCHFFRLVIVNISRVFPTSRVFISESKDMKNGCYCLIMIRGKARDTVTGNPNRQYSMQYAHHDANEIVVYGKLWSSTVELCLFLVSCLFIFTVHRVAKLIQLQVH
jgi:hypothetical protein